MWTRAEWKEESANASRAIKLESKGIGHPTPLQRALVLPTMASNLKAFIDERSQADAILMKADPSLGQSHIADYPEGISEEMQYCKGWYWEPRTNEFVDVEFYDYVATSLHLNKSAFLIGSAGAGKSTLLRMLARRFCLGQKKESFIFTKHLDPVGVLTQAGMTSDIGCLCSTDFDPVSQNTVPLSAENWKSVTDPEEGGQWAARHHVAEIKKFIPRLFAVNGTESEPTSWFYKYDCTTPMASLVSKNKQDLMEHSSDVQAQCRRVIIFVCPRVILLDSGVQTLVEDTNSKFQASMDTPSELGLTLPPRR